MIGRLIGLGGTMAGGLPVTFWIVIALAASLAGVEGLRRVQTATLKAEVATEKKGRSDDRIAAANAALVQAGINAKETQRRLDAQQETVNVSERKLADAVRDRDAARGVALRLSGRLDSLAAAARGTASNPAATPECKAVADSAVVLTELLGRAQARAGELAEYADGARIRGQQCEAIYDSLKGPP